MTVHSLRTATPGAPATDADPRAGAGPAEQAVWRVLETVADPEIPVLTVQDLGIIRDVQVDPGSRAVRVAITPTYNGCPAMREIEQAIRDALTAAGYPKVTVRLVWSPAWTTDWMTDEAREKLRAYGISPPARGAAEAANTLFGREPGVACPQCGARDVERVSAFGSTACKAQYRCNVCLEPFEHFKCI